MGSLFSSGKPPAQPDYGAAVNAQTQGQQNLASFNTNAARPDEYTPTGSRTWSRDANGNYTSTTSLSPEQEGLYWGDVLRRGQAGSAAADRLDQIQGQGAFNPDLNAWGFAPGASSSYQDNARAALLSRSNEDFAQQQAALDSKLANQGITVGSEAYNNAMQPLQRARVDAGQQATLGASQLGQTMFNQDLSRGQFANMTRGQQLGEALTRRALPMTEYGQLAGAAAPNMGAYQPFQSAQTQAPGASPDLLAYQDAIGRYNMQQAQNSGNWNAALQALATYFGSSGG